MTIQTVSITGDAILLALKQMEVAVPQDAECKFVRVDQNTREVFIDYSTSRPSPATEPNEAAWRDVNEKVYQYHVAEGLRRVRREAIAAQRKPCLRPPGCADNWWLDKHGQS